MVSEAVIEGAEKNRRNKKDRHEESSSSHPYRLQTKVRRSCLFILHLAN